jgi:TolA-binding protein
VLEAEAFAARLEAVIQLDDRRTALQLLDGRRAFAGRLGQQQLVTRAELRASAGRYADALGDFDRVLAPPAASSLIPADLERALYGRAVCLGRLGRHDSARAALTAYAQRFPDGKYATEVARLLAGIRP